MSGFYWLASYPKSGNTWLRLALASLSQNGAAPDFTAFDDLGGTASDRRAFDHLLNVTSSDLTNDEIERLRPRFYELDARCRPAPLVRKVHDAWTRTAAGEPLFPPSVTRAAVYIVRDPRDVAVSLSHHLGTTQDRAIAFMARADAGLALAQRSNQLGQRLLTWSAHVRSWMEAPVTPLLVRYEDMLAAPDAELTRVARHLAWDTDDDAIRRAVAATRFDALQAAEQKHGFSEKAHPARRFFRRGVAGGWREALTPAQAASIEAAHGEVMEDFGYLGR